MAYGDCPHGRKGTPVIGNFVNCPAECTAAPAREEYYLGGGKWGFKDEVNFHKPTIIIGPGSPVHSPSQPSPGSLQGVVDRPVGFTNIVWLTGNVAVVAGMDAHHPGLGVLGVVKSVATVSSCTIFDLVSPDKKQLGRIVGGDVLRFVP
jgi:hypothetical protein